MEDFDLYISCIWTDSAHYGYNELFDTRKGDWSQFDFGHLLELAHKAALLSGIDPNSKLAWIIDNSHAQGMAEFYKTAKSMITTRSRSMQAFSDRSEAISWLGY
jgi:hypothetical protein